MNDTRYRAEATTTVFDTCRSSTTPPHKPIGKELRGDIPDGQLAQHDLDASIDQLLQLLVENVPLGVHNSLVLLDVVNADLGILLLALQLELNVEQRDLWKSAPAARVRANHTLGLAYVLGCISNPAYE